MPRLVISATALTLFLAAAGCATSSGGTGPRWQSPKHQDHPLTGRIWDTRQGAFISEAALAEAVRGADFVLLGETHDNPDHHLLQARLVTQAAADGRKPALAFEMLNVAEQVAVDQALLESPGDPDAVARAVSWDQSGWPAFALYRPIFEAGLRAQLPIVAANLPREQLRRVMREGLDAVDPTLRARLEREPPLSDAALAALREEMRVAHCGHLPEGMMEGFVTAQRLRDAQMSLRMVDAGGEAGAVLIAGSGHVRKDRGVPTWLEGDAPRAQRAQHRLQGGEGGAGHPGRRGRAAVRLRLFHARHRAGGPVREAARAHAQPPANKGGTRRQPDSASRLTGLCLATTRRGRERTRTLLRPRLHFRPPARRQA